MPRKPARDPAVVPEKGAAAKRVKSKSLDKSEDSSRLFFLRRLNTFEVR
jgi:hypothetical protein